MDRFARHMNLLPVTLHVTLLQVNVAVCNLTSIAGVWVRGSTRRLDTRHSGNRRCSVRSREYGYRRNHLDARVARSFASNSQIVLDNGCKCERKFEVELVGYGGATLITSHRKGYQRDG